MQARLLIVEKQFTPLLGHVTVIAGRLDHSTKIAAAQLDRLDAALTDASRGLSSARGVVRMAAGSVSGATIVTTALTGLMA